MKKLELIIDQEMSGKSLDTILKEVWGLTKRQISQAKFRENGICINGARTRVSHVAKQGERLVLCLEETLENAGKIVPKAGALKILYEDEDVIALEKEGGMACHPGRGHYGDSLGNYLAAYLQSKGENSPVRAVGRLDKDTSGIMIYAKNQVAAARLAAQKQIGQFYKEYLALVQQMPKEKTGRIQKNIGKVPGEQMKMQVDDQGKYADTQYEVLQEIRDGQNIYALVRCRIATGRTHQIRVHLSWLGHPLLGDVLYGNGENPFFPGLALHAEKAVFLQPFTGEEIRLVSGPGHWNERIVVLEGTGTGSCLWQEKKRGSRT